MMGMKYPLLDRTGVLIIRLWIEDSHEFGLRARITQSALNSAATEESVAVAASVEDICAAVKQWVEAFSNPPSHEGNGAKPAAGPG